MRHKKYRPACTREDRAIARRVALRMGLSSGRALLRPYWHNPSEAFCKLVGPEHTPEDDNILRDLAWRSFCPLTYLLHLNV